MTDAVTPSFEDALKQLESIVAAMEGGALPLEASLKAFEQGIGLVRQCQGALRDAEQRVRILMQQGADTASLQDFPAEVDPA
jgi:exodeoxyribonuclease VII small subunit